MGNACMGGSVAHEMSDFFVALVGDKEIVQPVLSQEMTLSPTAQQAALDTISLWPTQEQETNASGAATSSFYRYSSLVIPSLTAEMEAKAIKIFTTYPDAAISYGGPHQQISSAFHAAAASGSLELLKLMTKHILEAPGKTEEARRKKLLRLVNRHSNGMRGKSPLMLAAMLGHPGCVKFLVHKGAECLAKEMMQGLTAIHLATREGRAACIDAMLVNEPELLNPLLSRTPPSQILNAATTSGFTALHYAVAFARHDCLETLLKYSPNLCAKSQGVYSPEIGMHCARGTTPLHVAAMTNNLRAAFFILRQYCAVSTLRGTDGSATPDPRQATDSMGRTAYQIASQSRLLNPRNSPDPGLIELLALDSDLQSITQVELPSFGPPKLQAITAGVLKAKLLADLERISDQGEFPTSPTKLSSANLSSRAIAPFSPSDERTSGGKVLSSSMNPASGPSSPTSVEVRPLQVKVEALFSVKEDVLAASEQLMAEMEGGKVNAGSEMPASAVCFICFDAEPGVKITGCQHRVCGACAKAMVEKTIVSKVLGCPFCRKGIRGFEK